MMTITTLDSKDEMRQGERKSSSGAWPFSWLWLWYLIANDLRHRNSLGSFIHWTVIEGLLRASHFPKN